MTGAVRDALTEALDRTRLTPEEKIRRMTETAKPSLSAVDNPIVSPFGTRGSSTARAGSRRC